MKPPQHALTVWEPWLSAMLPDGRTKKEGPKSVENRPWPPGFALGKRIWLHAGKVWDSEGYDFCAARGFTKDRRECTFGAVIGYAMVAGVAVTAPGNPLEDVKAWTKRQFGKHAAMDLYGNRWFFGPYGWLLTERTRIKPVLCRGYQKLWKPEADVQSELEARFWATRPEAERPETVELYDMCGADLE